MRGWTVERCLSPYVIFHMLSKLNLSFDCRGIHLKKLNIKGNAVCILASEQFSHSPQMLNWMPSLQKGPNWKKILLPPSLPRAFCTQNPHTGKWNNGNHWHVLPLDQPTDQYLSVHYTFSALVGNIKTKKWLMFTVNLRNKTKCLLEMLVWS